MGGQFLATAFVPYAATTSSASTDHPVSNVTQIMRPFMTWRPTTPDSTQWVVCDFTNPQTLDGVYLHHLHATSVTVEGSANGSSWPSFGTFPIAYDPWRNRRAAYLRLTGFTYRFLRISLLPAAFPESDPDWVGSSESGDIGTFEIGVLAPVASVIALDQLRVQRPFKVLQRSGDQSQSYVSGGFEVQGISRPWVELALALEGPRTAALTALGLFDTSPAAQPVLFVDTLRGTVGAYLTRRMTDDETVESFALASRSTLGLREAI